MITIPQYTKVMTLGSSYTENALVGPVIVQEKIDGSQFRFGINRNRELLCGSKGTIIHHPDENKMFKPGAEYIFSIGDMLKKKFLPNTFFYGEYLQKPKHNVLKYGQVPKNHIVLFDVMVAGKWVDRITLRTIANMIGVDIIPELYKGEIKRGRIEKTTGSVKSPAIDFLTRILETNVSYLGEEKIEGVVIKNYSQTIVLGGNVFPLFTKFVREEYKERHRVDWKIKSPKGSLELYIQSFKNEARWQKALIHLQEKGKLEKQPKDIGALIKQVQKDIVEEEGENIKKYLYNKFIKDIHRVAVRGLPEWYKEKLLENVK